MFRLLFHIIIINLLLLSLFGCAKEDDYTPSDIVKYYSGQSQGKFIDASSSDLKFYLTYVPSEALAVRDMENEEDIDEFYLKLKEYKDYHYFNLLISNLNKNTDVFDGLVSSGYTMEGLISHFMSDLQKTISLNFCGKKSFPEIYHFERTYGISPYRSIMLGFLREDCEEFYLQMNDDFLKSSVNFEITSEYLKQFPRLK